MNQLSNNNSDDLFENLSDSIEEILNKSRQQAYQAVNSSMLFVYWTIGQLIVENEQKGNENAEYRETTLENFSIKLSKEFGTMFTTRNLKNMRKFYLLFQDWDALRYELNWAHYRSLLRVENEKARQWYIEETIKEHWSSRQLDRQISTMYYERVFSSQYKNEVVVEANDKLKNIIPEQFVKDPYVLEFIDLKDYPAFRESVLEQALIDNLQSFLLELGRGFCFVARQKLLQYEDEGFYIDLVFYHSILKCYVLTDLKIGKLTHGDVGQMDSYIRMFDDLYKNDDDNPTIGLLLCSEKNETIAKYSVLDDEKQMFESKYILTLPTAEELEKQIETERYRIEEAEAEIKKID